jgi:hypothetical protein
VKQEPRLDRFDRWPKTRRTVGPNIDRWPHLPSKLSTEEINNDDDLGGVDRDRPVFVSSTRSNNAVPDLPQGGTAPGPSTWWVRVRNGGEIMS